MTRTRIHRLPPGCRQPRLTLAAAGAFAVGLTFGALPASPGQAAAPAGPVTAAALPPPTSSAYCVEVQKFLASTTLVGANTLFTDMPAYRASKPAAKPLQIYQVVTYAGALPIVVSCKVKTSAHLRAVYGTKAAGVQRGCADVAERTRAIAIDELRREGRTAASARAAAFVIDRTEPYVTGSSYLGDFQSVYLGGQGRVHVASPGLFQNYDSWITMVLPEIVRGQHYCHLPTVPYLKAIANGEMPPGRTITTGEGATVQPR